MYNTHNTPQCNVIQTVPHVQCSVNDLNGVTEKNKIKHELRKWGPFETFGRNGDRFKHSVRMRIIRNKYYENEDEKGI